MKTRYQAISVIFVLLLAGCGQDEPDPGKIDITPPKPPKKPTGKPQPTTTDDKKPEGAQGTPQ